MLTDEIVATSLHSYRDHLARKILAENDALLDRMNHLLYGDSKNQTKWQKFKRLINCYKERVSDAWLVLTGQAFIGYD